MKLRYCPAPALCDECYKKLGGLNGVHGEACRAGAEHSQQEQDAIKARLDAGDSQVSAAWGSWHESVPEGMVGVMFTGNAGDKYFLMYKGDYDPGQRKFLSDYASYFAAHWADHA